MTEQEVGFIIDTVVQEESLVILGRCGDAPIHVGEVFDAVFHYKPRRYPDESGSQPVRDLERPASIRVIGIESYKRSLDCLGEGMTGSLTIEGEGLEHLAPGWILGRKSEPVNGSAHENASSPVAAAR